MQVTLNKREGKIVQEEKQQRKGTYDGSAGCNDGQEEGRSEGK